MIFRAAILIFKMFFMLPKVLSYSNCILILIIFNFASSAPLKSQRHSSFQSEQGFSTYPKILEIQLPLKISSKEDLLAWSKYVSNLLASNFTSTLRNFSSVDKRIPLMNNSASKSKDMIKKMPANEKRQGLNYPVRRLKEPHMQKADEKVIAYPLPMGAMKPITSPHNSQDPSSLSTSNFNGPINFEQYMDFHNPFSHTGMNAFESFDFLPQLPANTYLPLLPRPIDITKPYQNAIDKNISHFEEQAKLQTMRNPLSLNSNNEFGQTLPIALNNGLTRINLSHIGEPLLTFPFQAVIAIPKEVPAGTMNSKIQLKDYSAIENFSNDFLPYFQPNYTLTNESGQVFNDFITDMSETKTRENVRKEKEEKKEQNIRDQKKQNQKKTKQNQKSTKKQKSSVKRQSFILGDLLRILGILRKLPKNTTNINVATPMLSTLKGTNSQKIQVAFEETPPKRGKPETFQAQQLNEDDDDEDDNNGNGNGNGNGNDEIENDENGDDEPQTESQEEDDEDEEEGGSIQALIELLPLAAPILEELSDPESDVDIAEVLQGAIPLLEGLSDPEEEGGVDIPSILLPLSQKLSGGPEGQSDSGAILGPLIQLIAPLIGPLSGPLLGPLSRTSSGPGGKEGSASVFSASAEPLSKPQGPYGQSVLSGLIASITAKLSKESAASADQSDVKSLVSSIVSGVLAGTSAGSSSQRHHHGYGQNGGNKYGQYGNYGNNGNRDPYQSPTSYGGYNYKPEPTSGGSSTDALLAPFTEVLQAFVKLSATSSTSSANLSGASSSSSTSLSASSSQSKEPEKPTYGPPTYGPPPPNPSYASPPSTNSPYVTFTRRQIKKL